MAESRATESPPSPNAAPSTLNRLIRGTLWNGLSQFGTQAFNMLITILLAHRLVPDDFGLFGMVVVFTAFIGYLSEFGLTAALIQRKDADQLDIDTVFWSSLILSAVLYLAVYLAAPAIAFFYKEPRLTLVTRVIFLTFLVMPLNYIPEVIQTKKLQYGIITAAEITSVIVSGLIAVAMAYAGMGPWSLVGQALSKTAVRAAVLVVLTRWTPRLAFSMKRLANLADMGVHVTLNNLMMFAADNVDYLLVGKLLGQNALGLYTMAFRVSKYPIQKIVGIFGKMLFPVFSTFNDEPERVNRNFLRLLVFFLSWVTPALIFGFFAAEPLVLIVLGYKWVNIVPLVKIFMVYLVINSFCLQNQPIFVALARVKIWNLVQFLSTVLLALCGFAGIRFLGLRGMAIAFTAVTSLSLIVISGILIKILKMPFASFIVTVRMHFLNNILLVGVLAALVPFVGGYSQNEWVRLAIPAIALCAWMGIVNRRDLAALAGRLAARRRTKGE